MRLHALIFYTGLHLHCLQMLLNFIMLNKGNKTWKLIVNFPYLKGVILGKISVIVEHWDSFDQRSDPHSVLSDLELNLLIFTSP